jgi:hypothetical protein
MELTVQEVDWVKRNKEASEGDAVVNEVLYRMHGKPTPRSWIVAFVVQFVNVFVEEIPNVSNDWKAPLPRVHGSVCPVKVKLSEICYKKQPEQRVSRIFPKVVVVWNVAGSPQMSDDNLVCG